MSEQADLRMYRKLAEYLDGLAGNFPAAVGGEEIVLLRTLFSPEEAALAVHLTLEAEPASVIGARVGLTPDVARERLETMAHKGLIFPEERPDGSRWYQAVPFVVGIYEFQIDRMGPEFLSTIGQYFMARKQRASTESIPQVRTIPIRESLSFQAETLAYQEVDALIEGRRRYMVTSCICRTHAKLLGGGCDAPVESCLGFDEMADYYIREGKGREITLDEVREILRKADAANLVLQPSNSKKAGFICCCCGCCCGILGGLKRQAKPAEVVASAYIARLDADVCEGCWTCLDRCQMDALSEDGMVVALNADRCIGCGLCVSTCPSGALTLVPKGESAIGEMPETVQALWRANKEAWAARAEG